MLNGAFIGRSSATINKIHKLVHGEFGYGLVAAYVSLFHRPIKTRVTIDDEIVRESKLGAFGVCLTDVISDFEMVPGNHPKKGDFAVFFCKKLGGLRLLRLMLKAIDGKHIDHKHVEILRGKKVVIESKKPHVWESEGEIPSRKATRLEVEYVPEAVNLIIPRGWKYGFTKKERQEAIRKVLHREPFHW
jgi:diacylglycerol kinase family enzyme